MVSISSPHNWVSKRCCVVALFTLWFGATGLARATSCIEPPQLALEEAFETADAIVVMQATGCAGRDIAQGQHCPSSQYVLHVIEVLKEASPARDYSGVFASAGPMGCGYSFSIGPEYLLYLDEMNRPIYCEEISEEDAKKYADARQIPLDDEVS